MSESTSYTAFRVTHASHRHVHDTSVVKFVGPVPHGWLAKNRKRWYMPHSNYHRNTVAFRSARSVSVSESSGGERRPGSSGTGSGSGDGSAQHQAKRWRAEADKNRAAQDAVAEGQCSAAMQAIAAADGQLDGSTSHATRDAASQTGQGEDEYAPAESLPIPKSTDRAPPSIVVTPSATPPSPPAVPTTALSALNRPALNVLSPLSEDPSREPSSVSAASFVTARESLPSSSGPFEEPDEYFSRDDVAELRQQHDSGEHEEDERASSVGTIRPSRPAGESDTTGPTEYSPGRSDGCAERRSSSSDIGPLDTDHASLLQHNFTDSVNSTRPLIDKRASCLADRRDHGRMNNLVRFTTTDHEEVLPTNRPPELRSADSDRLEQKVQARQQKEQGRLGMLRRGFRRRGKEGELVRSDRLLVRVESSRDALPSGYSESSARKVVRRVDMHWRELICAARLRADGLVDLDFHKNRRFAILSGSKTKTKPYLKLTLDPRTTRANFYSTLDKTIVVSYAHREGRRGSKIFILRPRSVPISIEWYAYIQTCLGTKPQSSALIRVPGLSAKLRIDLQRGDGRGSSRGSLGVSTSAGTEEGSLSDEEEIEDDEAAVDVDDEGRIVVNGTHITGEYLIDACWKVLQQNRDWAPVLRAWAENEKLGLCWRRYDRLEWAHGESAKQLIGSWAMRNSHELEFRPKEHYPTSVRLTDGDVMPEPAPIEGFAIRLTGCTGKQARFGKVYYKRMYLCSYDSMLFYTTPSKAQPPPPPQLGDSEAEDFSELVYDVDPYPLDDAGHVTWLRHDVPHEYKLKRDKIAATEAARRVNNLRAGAGFIDMSSIVAIRKFRRDRYTGEGAEAVPEGEAVDYHATGAAEPETLLTEEEAGLTGEIDDERMFELVLQSGVIVRFQVYSKETCGEWMSQLDKLARYWRLRLRSDMRHLQTMRESNMSVLHIDADQECYIGQDASKWEVSRCQSDAQMYNFCPFSSCRTITLRGLLYRKPRTHATFRRYACVVAHGQLLVYAHNTWSAVGGTAERSTHDLHQVVDLRGCYVYSGAVTVDELLNMNDASDRDGPGRHSLPRIYDDGWTTREEQESLCFVIWQARKRAALTGVDRQDATVPGKAKVSRLGVEGRSHVYMTRSRQERDLWVQALNLEIERTCGGAAEAL